MPFRPVEVEVHESLPSGDDGGMLSKSKHRGQAEILAEVSYLLTGPSGGQAATIERVADLLWGLAFGDLPDEGGHRLPDVVLEFVG